MLRSEREEAEETNGYSIDECKERLAVMSLEDLKDNVGVVACYILSAP